MFAEALDGWIFAGFLALGSVAGTLLALVALFPAAKGNRRVTVIMVAPAFIVGFYITAFWGYDLYGEYLQDPTKKLSEYAGVLPWILFGGLPTALSLFGLVVAWLCNWEKKQQMRQ
jgi:hypothetical protein